MARSVGGATSTRAPGGAARWLALALAMLAVGCTSIKSTFLHRDDADTKWKTNHLHGVPITLKVPTHVKLIRTQTYYLVANKEYTPVNIAAGVPLVTHDFRYELVYTEKIFTVDFKRPAAGTLKYKAGFNGQYFNSIESEIEDRTIKETGEALDKILARVPLAGKPTGAGGEVSGLTPIESTVASAVYSLDDPMLEDKIAAFLSSPCPGPGAAGPWAMGPMGPPPAVGAPLILTPDDGPATLPPVPDDAAPPLALPAPLASAGPRAPAPAADPRVTRTSPPSPSRR